MAKSWIQVLLLVQRRFTESRGRFISQGCTILFAPYSHKFGFKALSASLLVSNAWLCFPDPSRLDIKSWRSSEVLRSDPNACRQMAGWLSSCIQPLNIASYVKGALSGTRGIGKFSKQRGQRLIIRKKRKGNIRTT